VVYSINSAPDNTALVRVSSITMNLGIVNTSCHKYIDNPKAINERMNNGKARMYTKFLSFISQVCAVISLHSSVLVKIERADL